MFLVAKIKEACGKPKYLNLVVVYDNYVEKIHKEERREFPSAK